VIPRAKPYYRFDAQHEPDVWFDAVQVWEVKAADLSISPVHCAAAGMVGIITASTRFIFYKMNCIIDVLSMLEPPHAGSGVVRIDPLRFLAGCRTVQGN